MAKNLGLMAKIGSGCLATLVSLVGIDAAQALDFTFSWDSSSGNDVVVLNPGVNTPTGETAFLNGNDGTATGSFTINKNAGESFVGSDLSNISVTIFDGSNNFTRDDPPNSITSRVAGTISNDGSSITFTNFFLTWDDGSAKGFACGIDDCGDLSFTGLGLDHPLLISNGTKDFYTNYTSPSAALASINITPASATPVPFEINPNSGILILIGLWGTKTLIERKKHSQSINS